MARLILTLLGGFQARLDAGPPLTLPTKKSQALLAYLALPAGREHARDKLAALLWGDLSQGRARNSLRQALFGLRQAVEPVRPACLRVEGATVALNADAADIDAVTFERLVGERTPEALGQAVELYRGDLLDGLALHEPPFEEWLMGERERLRELALEALAGLLAAQRAAGAVEEALQTGLRLIALDPLQEPVHRTLMRLYVQLGRRGSALHQYQLCVGVLQRELGVEPEEETKELYQEILRRRPSLATLPESGTSDGGGPRATLRSQPLGLITDTPFIGRDREMARLRTLLAEAVSGQGWVATVVGEAGVGKTRLVAELAAEVDQVRGRVLIGRCHESEQILPFGPWVDALRAGLVSEDRGWLGTLPLTIRRELGRLLPEAEPGDGESAAPPEYMKLFEGVGLLLGHVTARQPTVLILEDVHWADEMSVRLLAFIGRRLKEWRLLLLVTARAEDLVEAPMLQRTFDELDREPHVATVALGPLSRGDTVALVKALSRAGSVETAVARLSEQVWHSSEGNPFVVVDAMRAVAEEALSPGLGALSLPERVRHIIGRQLDRLGEGSRELVALASVVGREFEFALLQHVSGLAEEEAARAVEVLTRRFILHGVGERLDFTHDRLREVAYGRILAPRRKVLHRRVAEALATLHEGGLEPHDLALGLHYLEGEAWEQAVVHLRRAGAGALQRSANRDARACFERALAALAHLPENRFTLEQGFEIRLTMRLGLLQLGEFRAALEDLLEARVIADRLDDDTRRVHVSALMTSTHANLGELDGAMVAGTHALEIAGRLQDHKLRVLTRSHLSIAHYLRGEYEQVIPLAAGNCGPGPADWEHFGPAGDRFVLVLSLALLGRFAEAAEVEAEATRLAELTDHAFAVGWAHLGAGFLHISEGAWVRAHSRMERGLARVRAGNIGLMLPAAISGSALVLAELGEVSEAQNRLREGCELLEGRSGLVGVNYMTLGRACLRLGRLDDARRLAERALEFSQPYPGFAAESLHLLGDVATHPDSFDAEKAQAHYRQALVLAEPRGMRPLIAHCHLGLARVHGSASSHDQGREHLTIATRMYGEMDMRFWLEQAKGEMMAAGPQRGR